MQLDHDFVVPVPVDEAWRVLLDVERIAPCMPGATLDTVSDEEFTGRVKVKVGPITVTYKGTARFVRRDEDARVVVIEATGKETRGTGTASATITATLVGGGASTDVRVSTDLAITGKPAQFGRGVMAEIGAKLIGQFSDCLADELGQSGTAASPADVAPPPASPAAEVEPAAAADSALPHDPAETAPAAAPAATPVAAGVSVPRTVVQQPRRSAEAINLLDTAGAPVLKRVAPAAAVVLALVLGWLLGRRGRR
ncbi:MAG: SRPBCC family protein [Actinomycetota bacterium]|nr:SRPBCC family protein [Actinomycetota bacterium]